LFAENLDLRLQASNLLFQRYLLKTQSLMTLALKDDTDRQDGHQGNAKEYDRHKAPSHGLHFPMMISTHFKVSPEPVIERCGRED
jgi:hypothetical protein